MNKDRLIQVAFLAIVGIFLGYGLASASEIEGSICTGLGCPFDGVVISAPTAIPGSGTYSAGQVVTLIVTGASSIHFTTDGSNPSCSDNKIYSGPFSVNSSQTVNAISCYPNEIASTIASYSYTISSSEGGSGNTGSGSGSGSGGGGSFQIITLAGSVDTNSDAKIDILDFNALMVNWGKTTAKNVADFNSDGKVDIFDFNLLMVGWTK